MSAERREASVREAAGRIERAAIDRYAARFHRFGPDPRSLGWDSRGHQWIRFRAVTELVDLRARRVLDIGCGFADLYGFLREAGVEPASYLGVDINPVLLEVAASRFPQGRYERRNILLEPYQEPVADVGVMLGLLNFRLQEMDNYDYAGEMIRAAFAATRDGLVVDFLSARRTPGYPEEAAVFYFEPERMLEIGFSITPAVVLKHDYPPIPQREFMLWLRKEP
jgi:SAM-dependent methyltransferase